VGRIASRTGTGIKEECLLAHFIVWFATVLLVWRLVVLLVSGFAMVLSDYIKLRILSLYWKGYTISAIKDVLVLEDQTIVSRQSIRLFLKHYSERGYIGRKPGSGMTLKLSPAILELIEYCMRQDDETTATQLQARLAGHNVHVSVTTILRNR